MDIAIMGYGVVGSGVAEVLRCNADSIAQKAGEPIRLRRILDLRSFPADPLCDRFTVSFEDIVNDPDIGIVVETMGGLHPAYDYVKRCLEAGKSVVTSNKELVAEKGDELLALAKSRNLNFLFEASVGGGIPILRPLDQCLAANEVTEVAGILNGTTNFMLTRMIEQNETFDQALEMAQQLGYAEKDPTADVAGLDACRKICILASLAFGKHVRPETVCTEGIQALTRADVRYAKAAGGVLKLIGHTRRLESGRIQAMVAPMVVPDSCLLSQVRDVFNAVLVRGNMVGDTVFYGRGAGKLPTASAVMADVIDEVKHVRARKYLFWEPGEAGYVLPADQWESRWLLRFVCRKPEARSEVLTAFPSAQVLNVAGAPEQELAVATAVPLTEPELTERVGSLTGADLVRQLRIADL